MQTMEYYSATKRNEPEDTKRDGGNLKAYCRVREANLKMLHSVWFQPCDIPKKSHQARGNMIRPNKPGAIFTMQTEFWH